MTRFNSLLLDRSAWDLVIDGAGDIAMGEPPYALAQDVASAVKLFRGELWYDTTKGIPYFEDVLGQLPPQPLLVSYVEMAALTVPGTVSAQCILSNFDNRSVSGQILFIDEVGEENGVSF